jgi:mandelate racemase
MSFETLTLKSIRARPVVLKLNRSVVARIATFAEWPLILIDLYTEEGVIGRSFLEPYVRILMRYLIPALHDLGEMLQGRRLAPIEFYGPIC